ncbi:MAG: hypothetical protein B7733_03075 [Myxococcales bacterium FL481]|nr:MAG: hypothetical protein B7733_03075 [Myxococcales bacterium FL481]
MTGLRRTTWLLVALFACQPKGGGGASQREPAVQTPRDGHESGPAARDGNTSTELATRFELPPLPPEKPPPPPPGPEQAGDCPARGRKDPGVGVMVSPVRPVVGRPVTVLAATLDGEAPLAVRLQDAKGQPIDAELVHRDGVPATTVIRFTPRKSTKFKVIVGREGQGRRCLVFWARRRPDVIEPPPADFERVWATKRAWTAGEEALFSAWVRELFSAPRGEDLAVEALDRLTRDRKRNVLHNALGFAEDDRREGLRLRPDCADTPYFLRAYYAWKRGLPFGFRHCSRGGKDSPPTCRAFLSNESAPDLTKKWREALEDPEQTLELTELDIVQHFFRRTLAWGVHTGNGRTAYSDSNSDHYPVRLDRQGVRPGTIYADPYGHVFVVVELMSGRNGRPGVLYAIDGQPDGSITRKRFWEGNFLWNPAPHLGGSGFKAFRPIAYENGDDGERELTSFDNTKIRRSRGDFDPDVGSLDAAAFYDRMDTIISPGVRDPFRAQAEAVVALAEAVRVRLTSVENGEKYVREHPGEVVEMPWGHAVFETVGPWENFSTPARDLRLLVAMDVVRRFGEKVARQSPSYGVNDPAEVTQLLDKLEQQRRQMLRDPAYAIAYRGSNGREQSLSLEALLERATRLEVAYNPNDCPEVRWGAAPGSEEMRSCTRRAPDDQQRKMEAYRGWFKDRRRPSRGDRGPDVPGVERPSPEP